MQGHRNILGFKGRFSRFFNLTWFNILLMINTELVQKVNQAYERGDYSTFANTILEFHINFPQDIFSSTMIKSFIQNCSSGGKLLVIILKPEFTNIKIVELIKKIKNCDSDICFNDYDKLFINYEDFLIFVVRIKQYNKHFINLFSHSLNPGYQLIKIRNIRTFSLFHLRFFFYFGSNKKIFFVSNEQSYWKKNNIKRIGIEKLSILKDAIITGGSRFILYKSCLINPFGFYKNSEEEILIRDSLVVAHNKKYAIIRSFDVVHKNKLNVVSLLDSTSWQFGHFVGNILSRINIANKKIENIYLDSDMPQNHYSLVEWVAPHSNLLTISRGESIQVSKLYFRHPQRYFPDHVSNGSPKFSRSQRVCASDYSIFNRKNFSANQDIKLALLRELTEHSGLRKIINYNELKRILQKLNFKFFDIRKPLFENIMTISNSEIIIGESGSMASNLVVANIKNSNVFLFTSLINESLESTLAGYLAFLGNSVTILISKSQDTNNRQSSFEVDLKLFQKMISERMK